MAQFTSLDGQSDTDPIFHVKRNQQELVQAQSESKRHGVVCPVRINSYAHLKIERLSNIKHLAHLYYDVGHLLCGVFSRRWCRVGRDVKHLLDAQHAEEPVKIHPAKTCLEPARKAKAAIPEADFEV